MTAITERRYYIDWVRVLAFFLLIFFHCAMPFVSFNWEIKNQETSAGLSRLVWWMHQWRLPLLFFVSGAGIYFSLRSRSIAAFAGERIVRLFVPLVFAMLFTIPLQVYFEKLQRGLIAGSYAKFYPTVWNFVPYPDGSLSWSHMWFVVYLFVFCILLLPIFALFKIELLKTLKDKLANGLSGPAGLFLLVIPLIFYYYQLYLPFPEQMSLLDDWFLFIFSLTLLLYGYLLAGSNWFWETCSTYRFWLAGIALVCIGILLYRYWWQLQMPKKPDADLYFFGALSAVHIWCLILAVLGFARKHLNFSNPFLRYTNQAVYPFYILHQTIIVVSGYYVVQWPLPIFVKLLVLVITCFAALLLLYHFVIRRFLFTRILYGLKLRKPPVPKSQPPSGSGDVQE